MLILCEICSEITHLWSAEYLQWHIDQNCANSATGVYETVANSPKTIKIYRNTRFCGS